MRDFYFRPATQADAPAIRALIRTVRINPLNLDWRRFVLAVDPGGEMLGCGQIKPHRDGSRELASIAVWPRFQRQGIGRAIIRYLLERSAPPLYLTCRASLKTYYQPFGFQPLPPTNMPPYFRLIWTLFRPIQAFVRPGEGLLVMRWK